MSGKKNRLIKRWAVKTNRPYRIAKKTWKKLSHIEREQVTRQMEFEIELRDSMGTNESSPQAKENIF